MSFRPSRPSLAQRLAIGVPVMALALGGAVAMAQDAPSSIKDVDWLEFGLTLLGGLVLFLFGVTQLARQLKDVSGDKLKAVLRAGSSDRLRGLASGTVVTILLDSSSAVIILIIALIDAGAIGSAAALPVILGANIGTTFSSQIFALKADTLAPILMTLGLLAATLLSSEGVKRWAWVVFYIGLVLFGLSVVGMAAAPLKDVPDVKDWLARFANPWVGMLAGAAVTVALQSSSAMMGLIIVLAGQGLIPLEAGLALMLGAEIGTCADTLVATIGRSRAAIRAGVFHLVFNIISVTIGLALIGFLAKAAVASAGRVDQQIANAHVLFNVAGALVFLVLAPWCSALLMRLIPDRRDAEPATAGAAA